MFLVPHFTTVTLNIPLCLIFVPLFHHLLFYLLILLLLLFLHLFHNLKPIYFKITSDCSIILISPESNSFSHLFILSAASLIVHVSHVISEFWRTGSSHMSPLQNEVTYWQHGIPILMRN